MKPQTLWDYEDGCTSRGFRLICGVDEAGRGPLAGPVCAAAVILPLHLEIAGLNDSKKLSEARREALYGIITEQAVAWAVAFAGEKEIDAMNILQATFLAMRRAVEALSIKPEIALVDGNREPPLDDVPVQTIVGGDGKSASIAAASILAKVTRDRLMVQLDRTYPQYGFAVHKGYGTRRHYAALEQYGPSPIHRMTFLKKFYEKQQSERSLG